MVTVDGVQGWKPSTRPQSLDDARFTKTDYHLLKNRLVLYVPPVMIFYSAAIFICRSILFSIFIPVFINAVAAIQGI